ncbi:MAG: hypothetical protein ACR2NU_03180, partial [Aeoliella sp.]
EIQTPEGDPVEGFAMSDCPEIIGDHLDRPVAWAAGSDVSRLIGQAVRLRFQLKDADLFSFKFTRAD